MTFWVVTFGGVEERGRGIEYVLYHDVGVWFGLGLGMVLSDLGVDVLHHVK